jgi:hypothetical protein
MRIAWLGQRSRSDGDGLTTYSRETVAGLRQRGVEVEFFHHDCSSAKDGSIALPALTVSKRFRIPPPGTSRKLALAFRGRSVDLVHLSLSCRGDASRSLRPSRHHLGTLSLLLYRICAPFLARFDRVIVFGTRQPSCCRNSACRRLYCR